MNALTFGRALREGYWFCDRCEKVVAGIPDTAESPARCPGCKHRSAHYFPPCLPAWPPVAIANSR